MIGLVLCLSVIVTSLLVAAAMRFQSVVSTLLVAYLALVGNLGLVTLVLSPFREVTRGGLAVAEAVLLAAALAVWLGRGRPGLPLRSGRDAISAIVSSRLTLLYLLAVVAALAYELMLGLTVPPDNWDSLTYHLAKVAAWVHHGGIYWIPNAPTVRINELQPLAEQQILFLFVATHRDLLYAIPQYLAELAILVAVYGTARRLGSEVRAAACSAFLLATFTLVALETATAQTDLVAAALVAVGACLLLGGGGVLEPFLAGVAVGVGAGAKLTAILVWPILIWLALARGRKTLTLAVAGALIGFAAIGCWSFVLEDVHTGHLFAPGAGESSLQYGASPSFPGSLVTGLSMLYEIMDIGPLWHLLIYLLVLSGVIAAGLAGAYALRRTGVRRALFDAGSVAVPFVAPALVIVGGAVLAFATRRLGMPVSASATYGELNNTANEDVSAFGPIGGVVLIAIPVVTAAAYFRHKVDIRHLALACALPIFVILLSLQTRFNPWLPRYLIVPAVLTAPLFSRLFRSRTTTAAYLVVSCLLLGLALTRDTTKMLGGSYGPPWQISWVQALEERDQPYAAAGLAALDETVPANACVGAVLDGDNPSYLLSGRDFRRRVVYLSLDGAVPEASRAHLTYVVISTGQKWRPTIRQFKAASWTIQELGGEWELATAPNATSGACT